MGRAKMYRNDILKNLVGCILGGMFLWFVWSLKPYVLQWYMALPPHSQLEMILYGGMLGGGILLVSVIDILVSGITFIEQVVTLFKLGFRKLDDEEKLEKENEYEGQRRNV